MPDSTADLVPSSDRALGVRRSVFELYMPHSSGAAANLAILKGFGSFHPHNGRFEFNLAWKQIHGGILFSN